MSGKKKSAKTKEAIIPESPEIAPSDETSTDPETPIRFPIVGIGASAGGLEALQELFATMPADTGMTFVVVTHLHRGQTSMLPELLGKETSMQVTETKHGERVEPNRVYVASPGGPIGILGGTLQREADVESESHHLVVDHFFRSLAQDRREHAICIVLSGTGSDGTLGVRAVKAESGMAMAQAPQTAKYAGMPSSAIATSLVDYVLPVKEMADQLVAYTKGPYLAQRPRTTGPSIPRDTLQKILVLLRNRTGHDFTSYKVNTVRRRIERRMNVHQVNDPLSYIQYLRDNPHELDRLFSELLISVTNFFRDPIAFEVLCAHMTELIRSRPEQHRLRAWVPGCATGEEAYSIAITLYECMEAAGKHFDIQVFGTDLDRQAIEVARRGVYADGIKADVSKERLLRWFVSEDNTHRVRRELRELVVFAPQDVTRDPPFMNLDLVSCRNMLIYMESDLQHSLLPIFHYTLRTGGLLFLGPSESLGDLGHMFAPIDNKWKIFRRNDVPASPYPVMPLVRAPLKLERQAKAEDGYSREARPQGANNQMTSLLLNRFAPTCIIVNDEGEIAYIHGRTGLYLEPNEGQPRHNVLDMAREGLASALGASIRQVAAGHHEVVRERIRVKTNGSAVAVRLVVSRIEMPETLRGLILISIEPAQPPRPEKAEETGRVDDEPPGSTEDLQWELRHTKETLQTTVEELETSNEELKSANEELQSTNEELQSTNEELETSKEELQSLNEELTTVNAELNSKVEQLSRANDDMHNLLNSTQIATIFLDTRLRVKRYTDRAQGFIRLIETDIGRPLSDLATKLVNVDLVPGCEEVLQTLTPKSVEVRADDGSWQLLRIMPYRTTENMIDGIVITLVDVSRVKEVESGKIRSDDAREFFESIVQTLREPLLVLDDEHRVVSANARFMNAFDKQGIKLVGRSIYDLGDGQWNIPELHRLLNEILPENLTFEGFRVERQFPRVGRKAFLLNARRLVRELDRPGMILLAFEEVPLESGS